VNILKLKVGWRRGTNGSASGLSDKTLGNPLECVELTRRLVERREVRYAYGIWVLPNEAEELHAGESLPGTEYDTLSAPAQELSLLLSLLSGDAAQDVCEGLGTNGAFFAPLLGERQRIKDDRARRAPGTRLASFSTCTLFEPKSARA
jgi:hypothetical protein